MWCASLLGGPYLNSITVLFDTTLAWVFKGTAQGLTYSSRYCPGNIMGKLMVLMPNQFKDTKRFDLLH